MVETRRVQLLPRRCGRRVLALYEVPGYGGGADRTPRNGLAKPIRHLGHAPPKSAGWDSNPRSPPCRGGALAARRPTERADSGARTRVLWLEARDPAIGRCPRFPAGQPHATHPGWPCPSAVVRLMACRQIGPTYRPKPCPLRGEWSPRPVSSREPRCTGPRVVPTTGARWSERRDSDSHPLAGNQGSCRWTTFADGATTRNRTGASSVPRRYSPIELWRLKRADSEGRTRSLRSTDPAFYQPELCRQDGEANGSRTRTLAMARRATTTRHLASNGRAGRARTGALKSPRLPG